MRITNRTNQDERTVLIGMIVDRSVLAPIADKWEKHIMPSDWSNLVGGWCVDYFRKYHKPPGRNIEGLFSTWATKHRSQKETVDIVERFLGGLSKQYKKLKRDSNSQYALDIANDVFTRKKINSLIAELSEDLEHVDLEKAKKRIDGFGHVDLGAGSIIDLLQDEEAIERAFAAKQEPLIVYPGALGNFFEDSLERDGFIALMGPEKRGKTWWLLDMAWRAMLQKRKVLFFEVGDLSEGQVIRRFMARVSHAPLKPCRYTIPTDIERNPDEPFASVTSKKKRAKKKLNKKIAWRACKEVLRQKLKTKDSFFKLSVHPNDSLSISGLMSIVERCSYSGWVPDVIIVDYADILAPPHGIVESRDQINATWKGLRRLSQTFHCLVVTATQSDAASYYTEVLDRSNFSEDKRKFAHCTGMIGLNQTRDEKEQGLMRLNWLVLRESEFIETKCVHVAGCLQIANPAIRSCF